ncbi:MAG: hypothetical protein ACI855_001310 [Myxococcota bacterium]|jgi:hypothetical protein
MGRSLDNVLDGSTLWMSTDVGGSMIRTRQAVRNVPTSVRTHGAALTDANASCSMIGGLGYDSSASALYVCNGTSWMAVGAP